MHAQVWEIKQKRIIEMAADRGAFIDQSQSLNIHMVLGWLQNGIKVPISKILFAMPLRCHVTADGAMLLPILGVFICFRLQFRRRLSLF